jgi:MFS family permease
MKRMPYAWVIVFTLSMTELISWGALYYSFGVLLTPMYLDLGWSRAALSGGFSIGLLVAGLAAIPLGRWVDQHGPRLLMSCGSLLGVAMLLAWSQVHTLIEFYLVWAGIGLASAATLYEPAFATVAAWFWQDRAERTRALAVLTFFGGLASLAFIPLTGYLTDLYGWRGALIWLAAIVAAGTIIPHIALLRPPTPHGSALTSSNLPTNTLDRPLSPPSPLIAARYSAATRDPLPTAKGLTTTAAGSTEYIAAVVTLPLAGNKDHVPRPPESLSTTLGEAVRSAGFWWLSLAFSLMTLVVVTLNVHLVSYLIAAGHPSSVAALAAGAHGLFSVTGRLTLAPLAARMSIGRLLALLFLLQLGALIALLSPSIVGVIVYVILFGIGSGATTPVRAALVAERYGHASYGRINGALTTVAIWARVAAPVGAGLLANLIGYPWLFAGLALSTLVATGAVLGGTRKP